MAYGITSQSQIIDLNTIKSGCETIINELECFEKCGERVINAGNICNKKALSVDEGSLEGSIIEVGEQIKTTKNELVISAEQLIADATNVYNAQVTEYNEYVRQLEEQRRQQQQQNGGY
ncbi:MAG: hypothetical protein IJI22_01175 [Bacilli bacterium]|nr:hypothetical protein [Bacilli bacterium]